MGTEEPEASRVTAARFLTAGTDGRSVIFILGFLYSAQEQHSSLLHVKEKRPCHGQQACADNILSYAV